MYSPEFKYKALKTLEECNGSCILAARKLQVVCSRTIRRWRDEAAKPPRRHYSHLSATQKRKIAEEVERGTSVTTLADRYGVSITSVYNIRNGFRTKGGLAFMDAKESIEVPQIDLDDMPNDIEALKKRCAELEMDNAILEQTIEILKKDPGVDPSELTNREKAMVIDALSNRFTVISLCKRLQIPRCSYYYAKSAASRPDAHTKTRKRIRAIFESSRMTFGSERIWNALRCGDDGDESLVISEKVVRRLMREEGLVVIYNKKKRNYSSYKGEISEHPGDKVKRDFHADRPNEKWLTDITQFTLPGYKCYLSAIIDCFDGKVITFRLSKSPDAELANSTLLDAVKCLEDGDVPILHSDCGCHYRWPGWISICAANNIVRSMSKKACSPDNAACEAFFGRLKNEFFYYRDWEDVTFEDFGKMLSEYIGYYNGKRKKKSLGWMSPISYRQASGYAA